MATSAVIFRVLQEAGLVKVTKGYEGNRPHTSCRLTKVGRRRFLEYLAVLEQIVRDAATEEVPSSSTECAFRLINFYPGTL